VNCREWRDASPGEVAPLYAAERERWLSTLDWDPADALAIIEEGRVGGHVAGWIVQDDDGRPMGWTFYVLHNSSLQIGGLVAERPGAARCLLDAILDSPEATLAHNLSCFLFPDASGIASALVRQRFALRNSLYLIRSVDAAPPIHRQAGDERAWKPEDLAATVRILSTAYDGIPGAACFAPTGRREEWANYAWQLIRTRGCGRFDAALSRIVMAPGSSEPAGAVLSTWINEETIHIGQLAVMPACRRQGMAERLLESVFASASEAGARRVTLMVDAQNAPAVRLYTRLGFKERASFIYGSRAARRRVAA
jgi:mycothiol synthase